MNRAFNLVKRGAGGGGASASIYVTGLQESDSVIMSTPSGRTVAGVWDEVVKYEEDPNTKFLLHGNEIVETSHAFGITNNGVTLSSEKTKFFDKALFFNGSSKLIVDIGNSINLNTGDFTFEAWVYPTQLNHDQFFVSGTNSPTGSFFWGYERTTNKLGVGRAGVMWDTRFSSPDANTWQHLAVVRKNGVVTFYKNGTSVGSESNTNAYSFQNGKIYIGSQGNAYYYVGYMDEIRISDVARWDGNFSVPNEPYTNIVPIITDAYTFHANEYGLHTITASNDTKTSTEEVLVDALMDYWVEMDLSKLYLYKYGDERTSLTGGWSKNDYYFASGQGTVYEAEKNIDNMLVPNKAWSSIGLIGTNNAVNMSGYSKLKVIFTQSATGCLFNVSSAKNAISTTRLKYADLTAGTNTTNELDVSAIDTSAYVSFVRGSNSSTTAIYAIWLE